MDRKRFVIEPTFQDSLCIISVDTYHKMLDYIDEFKKTELIEGFIVQKMTKNAKHSYYSNLFARELYKILPPHTFLQVEKPLTLAHSEPEPDISIIYGTEENYFEKNPDTALLVIEIANSSFNLDKLKVGIYEKANVQNYWIVNIKKQEVDVYTDNQNCKFIQNKTYTNSESIPIFSKYLELRTIWR